MIAAGRLRVHEDGRVEYKRISFDSPWREPIAELVVAPGRKRKGGYHRVRVCGIRILLHRLVWLALRGPIPDGLVINHRNGDKLDNRLSNLELMTLAENNRHAIEHGLHDPYTPKNWSMTAEQVREIRRLSKTLGQAETANHLGITLNKVNRILRGRTYASVK